MTKNILITSISKKIPLINAVRNAAERTELGISIYGGDSDQDALGKYFVDHFWHMPRLESLEINEVLEYCHEHTIGLIVPTRDAELVYFATHKKLLLSHEIFVLVSDISAIEFCSDKLYFSQNLHISNLISIQTSADIKTMQASQYVVKEQFGSGSKNNIINVSKEIAVSCASKLTNPIYQEYIQGIEVSIDMYVANNHKVMGIISRTRDLVSSGESQVTSSFNSDSLEAMAIKFGCSLQFYGPINLQVIISKNNSVYALDCNPRFGGASTLSIAMGLDVFYWFILESIGRDLNKSPFKRSPYELRQIRYSTDLIERK